VTSSSPQVQEQQGASQSLLRLLPLSGRHGIERRALGSCGWTFAAGPHEARCRQGIGTRCNASGTFGCWSTASGGAARTF
jgi:hypothetical protein